MTKKGRRTIKFNYLLFPVYLIGFICIKIGQIISSGIGAGFNFLNQPATNPLAFFSLNYLFKTGLKIVYNRHKRGRPRIKPFFQFYRDKLNRELNYLVPKNSRIKILATVIILILSGYSYLLIKVAADLPSPDRLTYTTRPLTTQIYDRNGKLIYQFYQSRNRKLIQINDLPPYLIDATVAIEDKHFFYHPGFDIFGIIRAIEANQKDGQLQGASTITQQLIKNILLSPDQTITRKIKELVLAFWAERIYSKSQILQMYFNEIPYGGLAWGIEAASESYFSKPAHDIDLAESAYLAGLPAAPSEYSPFGSKPELGKQRQKEVLRRMVEDGYINQEQADKSIDEPLNFKPAFTDLEAPHFVMYVRSLLAAKYGERVVSEGGLKVVTSLDLDIQRMAETMVANQISNLTNLRVGNGAAMVMDVRNGQILAMVGSKSYQDPNGGNFNVTLALRQPGSSIKPITYTTAFKQGFSPGTVLLDTPTTFQNPWGQSYSPANYDGKFHGPVSIRTALGSSYNIPAVKTLALVGIPAMLQTARELGITTLNNPDSYGLSLTLGGGAVRMIDMMSVYSTFATGGIRFSPQAILTVTDSDGVVLEDNTKTSGERVLTEQVAYLINNILSDNQARIPAFGPHSLLEIPGHSVAVKTGTSDDKRDNWTFGYTPNIAVGVWVGNNDNSPMDPKLTSGITGAAPIWNNIITSLLSDEPNQDFIRPSGIVQMLVDGNKDLVIAGQVPKNVVGFHTVKQKDGTGNEKEVTSYSDPFTTYIADQTKQ